jgi:hypothetical protein
LVSLLSFLTVAFLFIDNRQVEKSGGVGLFIDRHLEVVDGLVHILAEFVKQHAHIEVGLEVFRVDSQSTLVELATLVESLIRRWRL